MTTEEPKASNSGRWQFSLRTLLLLVALAAIPMAWLGVISQQFAEREQASKLRHQVGRGNIYTDIGLFSIAYDLDFSGDLAVTDPRLKPLRELRHLRDLNLANTGVTDAGVQHLQQLSSLRRLDLRGTQVTTEGLKKLQAALPNCEIRLLP